jgi:hypothetical protein
MQLGDIKWFGTAFCLIGIALTSFNFYPANIFFGLVGSALWTYAGFKQNDKPLFLVEAVSTLLYALGFGSYVMYCLVFWGVL